MAGTAARLTAARAHPAQPAHRGQDAAGQHRVARRGQEQRGDEEEIAPNATKDASVSALTTIGPGLLKVSSAAPPSVTEAATRPAAEDQG